MILLSDWHEYVPPSDKRTSLIVNEYVIISYDDVPLIIWRFVRCSIWKRGSELIRVVE